MDSYITIFLQVSLVSLAIGGLLFAPWVPCFSKDLKRIFALAKVKPGEVFYDLGCGNGKTVFHAAKHHKAHAKGLEIGIPLYIYCQIKKLFTWNRNAQIKFKNLFKEDLSSADVVYVYGMPETLQKLRPKLEKELKKGARVVSYCFPVKGWKEEEKSKPTEKDVSIYLYQR